MTNDKSAKKLADFFASRLSEAEIQSAETLSEIASAITNARVERNMNQAQFAEYMGVSQSMVSKWENGDYNFTIEKLYEIAGKIDLNCNIKIYPKPKTVTNTTYDKGYTAVVNLYSISPIISKSASVSSLD